MNYVFLTGFSYTLFTKALLLFHNSLLKRFIYRRVSPNMGGAVILPPCWFPLNNSETVRSYPHSTFTQRGRVEVKLNAYDCVQEGEGGFSRLRTYAKKLFFRPQNRKTFLFLYKRSYYLAIYYCV